MALTTLQDDIAHWRETNASKLGSVKTRPGLSGAP
jgi:hypothetical protein